MSEITVMVSFSKRYRKVEEIRGYFPNIHIEKHLMKALQGMVAYGIDPGEYEPNKLIEDYLDTVLEKQFVNSIFWDEEFEVNDSLYLYDECNNWQTPPQIGGFAKLSCKLLAEIVREISDDVTALFLEPFAFRKITKLEFDKEGRWLTFSGILN